MAGFNSKTFSFLKSLVRNTRPPKTVLQGKKWFEVHQKEYEAAVKTPCNEVLRDIQKKIGDQAQGYRFPKSGFGRLYRDPRKASEEGPFKDWTGAHIAPPSDSMYEHPPGVWFQIGAAKDDVFVSGGLYMPSATQLRKIRTAFATHAFWLKRWESFLQSKKITSRFDKDHGDSLKTYPRAYGPDHPQIKWLKMTQFYLWRPYTHQQATASDFSAKIASDMVYILEFNQLIQEALDHRAEASEKVQLDSFKTRHQAFDF